MIQLKAISAFTMAQEPVESTSCASSISVESGISRQPDEERAGWAMSARRAGAVT